MGSTSAPIIGALIRIDIGDRVLVAMFGGSFLYIGASQLIRSGSQRRA
jgi:hypothetical protein